MAMLLVGGVGAFMPAARMGRSCATAAHVRAPACGMVASWYDSGQRLTAGGYGYDPEVQSWPSVGGTTGYHRMNGALPASAQFRLGQPSPGDAPSAEGSTPAAADDAKVVFRDGGTSVIGGSLGPKRAVRANTVSTAGVAPMPEQMVAWGCDEELWGRMPAGAHRDLTRFARDGIEHLAINRSAARSECTLGSAPAPRLCASSWRTWRLRAARHSQGEARPTACPATASGARASHLQSRRFHRLCPSRHPDDERDRRLRPGRRADRHVGAG